MAVDLADLVPYLEAELSPPGVDLYPTATTASFVVMLTNSFWEARLRGLYSNYTEADGIITPITGTTDLPRASQQLLILLAAYRVALTAFQNVNSAFRAQAGPVSYETQKSAQTLRGVLDALKARLNDLLDAVADQETEGTSTLIFDGYMLRSEGIGAGYSPWVG